jgi:hypothetical protein
MTPQQGPKNSSTDEQRQERYSDSEARLAKQWASWHSLAGAYKSPISAARPNVGGQRALLDESIQAVSDAFVQRPRDLSSTAVAYRLLQ